MRFHTRMYRRWLAFCVAVCIAGMLVLVFREEPRKGRPVPIDDYGWLSRAFIEVRENARILVVALDEPRVSRESVSTMRHYLLRPQRADLVLLNPIARPATRSRTPAANLAKQQWRVDDLCNASHWPSALQDYDAVLFTRISFFHRCHHPDLRNLDLSFAWIADSQHLFAATATFVAHLSASLCNTRRPGPFKILPAPIFEATIDNGTLAPLRREQVLSAIDHCGY